MRTGTGILTRDDVNVIVNDDIWYEELTRCLTVASLASLENHLSVHNISYTLDSAYSGSSYRLIPYDKISFTTTPTGPTGYAFNVFGQTSTNSGVTSLNLNATLVIYQGSTSTPSQIFDISGDIYQKRVSANLTYQGSTISESVFNQLYFFITGGWTGSSFNYTVFKTKGTSFNQADINKDTADVIAQTSGTSGTTTISTQSNPCLLSSIGTYDEFKQGLLGIYIYFESTSGSSGSALTISPSSWYPNAQSSTRVFTVQNLSGSLTVSSRPTWATVSISGSSITISITTNSTGSTRNGTVVLAGRGTDGILRTLSIYITQPSVSTSNPIITISDTEWTQDTTATISGYNVYKSNTISDKDWTIFIIAFTEYYDLGPLDIYIRSYAESNYDYAVAYELDYIPEPSTYRDVSDTATGVIASTKGNQQSGTGLASYTKVSYTIPDNNTHYISVAYRKDVNGKDGDDAAYVAVPNEYMA